MADPKFKFRFTIPLDIAIDVEGEDEDVALDAAEAKIKEFLDTVYGRPQDRLFADAGGDLPEPYEVSEDGVIIRGANVTP